MTAWRARLDWWGMAVCVVVLHGGLVSQVAGFTFAFLFDDPITGLTLLSHGFWVAGLGGAGLVYGMLVNATGSAPYPGGPCTYSPPRRRWLAAVWALACTPIWGVLSLPVAILVYGILVIGMCVLGVARGLHLMRRSI